jgi:hypothetical protein
MGKIRPMAGKILVPFPVYLIIPRNLFKLPKFIEICLYLIKMQTKFSMNPSEQIYRVN